MWQKVSHFFCSFSVLVLFAGIGLSSQLNAQGVGVPLERFDYQLFDRWDVLHGDHSPWYSGLQFYQRKDVAAFAMSLPDTMMDRVSLFNWQQVLNDNNEWLIENEVRKTLRKVQPKSWPEEDHALRSLNSPHYQQTEKPIWNALYRSPANLWEVNQPNFYLRANPMLNIRIGRGLEEDQLLFINQRGIALRGGIDDRVYFYTSIIESQARYPNYIQARIARDTAVPGAGFYKDFESSILPIDDGYDFLNGQGYIGFNLTSHIGMQLGHGRHFIGNGYRSLFLSDVGQNYFFLKFNTRVWKLHYQNLFTEMKTTSNQAVSGDERIPKKYMAAHYLGFQVNPKLQIGLFEAIIFSGDFELQYLNPIILYRVIEQSVGSPDNALLGLDWKANFGGHFQFYGQLLLDEFKFDELIVNRDGWWGNKFGWQAGLKYYDAFSISHLDLRAEVNSVRPYTYSHSENEGSYTHYQQVLAHPAGANFSELIITARYQPAPRWTFHGRFFAIQQGESTEMLNYGNNPLRTNTTRIQEYGNEIGQGVNNDVTVLSGEVEYQLFHNAYIGVETLYRTYDSLAPADRQNTFYIGGGFRLNLNHQQLVF